ncbi:hypothetical protein PAXRUDRAFT_824108 [Paxillus rubicundulus Ve08.2h10]|uniref:Uncharacterized protein n=1 Tax=Paxillus rubicundulus Ve08.2h10 TaxID=930991 RepID=A0A0D0DIL5_9AGAM|nr:hypothetical protein PAXRUDRAFT_824108 [Paxillus rubicundulus Ve08.2h10]
MVGEAQRKGLCAGEQDISSQGPPRLQGTALEGVSASTKRFQWNEERALRLQITTIIQLLTAV